jgi:hypothetical protein
MALTDVAFTFRSANFVRSAPVFTWFTRAPASDELKLLERAAPCHPATLRMNQLELVTQATKRSGTRTCGKSRLASSKTKGGEAYFLATLEDLSGECGSYATTDVLWRRQGGTLAPVMEQKDLNLESFPLGALNRNGDGHGSNGSPT